MTQKKQQPASWRNRIVGEDTVDPATLVPNPQNWRIHGNLQSTALQGLLGEVGWVQRVLVNRQSGRIIDGHLRLKLALDRHEPSIPVLYVDLSEQEERLVLATLDPVSALAEADRGMLKSLLDEVQSGDSAVQQMLAQLAEEQGIALGAAGGTGVPLEDVEPQIDRAEELRQEWGTEVGQLWQCGAHRLVCGDCTDKAVVERVVQENFATLVITDPPYGVSYADKNAFLNTIGRANRIEKPIENDHMSKQAMQALWKASFTRMAAVMAPGAVIYCFMPQGGDQMMMMMMMEGAGIEPRHELIWLKNNHVLGRVDYAYKHEPILYAWKEGGHRFYGDFQTSILEFPKPQRSDLHPTTKPVELIARLMENSSLPGQVVYDGFLGSGTTLIACEQLKRRCYGCEIDPGYAAVCLQRWVDLTHQTPQLVT